MPRVPRVVVLLEGRSDVAAVRALLALDAPSGVGSLADGRVGDGRAHDVQLVDMGGVTNVRHHLVRLVADASEGAGPRVLGLGDAAEAPFLSRALAAVGHAVGTRADMAALGFHVCDLDLEDELVRALGTARVQEVLAGLGLLDRFLAFRRQPAWDGRPVHDQLRRFAGTTSGRKLVVAEALASALTPSQVPAPLAALVGHIRAGLAEPPAGPPVRPFAGTG
ncbi:ATP-dependent endonuclease [Phycicoccus sp. Soil748]|uniref:ATP-dependent endonuclease n=1 Tax=Phycicoccus sp. Soil748 TaxID=1736397 RepID=UPI0012E3DE5E|nr:ATP-dependent endonuclease [Phycicoccus sp. Soil748]